MHARPVSPVAGSPLLFPARGVERARTAGVGPRGGVPLASRAGPEDAPDTKQAPTHVRAGPTSAASQLTPETTGQAGRMPSCVENLGEELHR